MTWDISFGASLPHGRFLMARAVRIGYEGASCRVRRGKEKERDSYGLMPLVFPWEGILIDNNNDER